MADGRMRYFKVCPQTKNVAYGHAAGWNTLNLQVKIYEIYMLKYIKSVG